MKWIKSIGGIGGVMIFIIAIIIFIMRERDLSKSRDDQLYKDYQKQQLYKQSEDLDDNFVLGDIVDQGKCFLNTLNITKSRGVKMNIYFPCRWKENDENYGDFPSLIKQYTHRVNDTLLVGISISIYKSPIELSPEGIKKLRSTDVLKKLTKQYYGHLDSSKNTEIDGVKGVEVLSENINDSSSNFCLINHYFCNGSIITITYLVESKNAKYASLTFNEYKRLFRRLENKTKFL